NWGLIRVAKPVKVTATLVDPADDVTPVLYTKAANPGLCHVGVNPAYDCAIAVSPMNAPPAQESIFIAYPDNVFRFGQPFVVTSNDVANGTQFSLVLAMNPNGL